MVLVDYLAKHCFEERFDFLSLFVASAAEDFNDRFFIRSYKKLNSNSKCIA